MMNNKQITGLVIAVIAIVGSIAYLSSTKAAPVPVSGGGEDVALPASVLDATSTATTTMAGKLSDTERVSQKAELYPRAKEIVSPTGFVNTGGKPITLSQYVGKKVVLLDIMTYSCINCIRTFPYLVDWYKKYEDKGLVIVAIHTPEFDFEKNIDNVKQAMAKYGITFPVVLDNNYGTWSAYQNLYWPRKYLIDIDGFIRYDHIGEGGYDETETMIQNLLKERADVLGQKIDVDMPVSTGPTERGSAMESPETYFGYGNNRYFGNGTPGLSGESTYAVPEDRQLSHFYLGGRWMIDKESIENTSAPAEIVYPFAAKHVYLVASADAPVSVQVTVDGKPLGSAAGADVVEKDGVDTFTVKDSRLYDVYAGGSFGTHEIDIKPQGKGLKAFTFTFGN